MSKPLIVLATPCFGGLVTHTYMMSILQLTQRASAENFDVDILVLGGDSLISRARSVLVSHFLDNPRATHLLFVDADISFECEQLVRMLRFEEDFVAGLYPIKQVHWEELPARVVGGEPLRAAGLSYVGKLRSEAQRRVRNGFATAEYAGTGFQLIRRRVFERMIAAYPQLRFRSVDALTNKRAPENHLYALFDCVIDPETGTYLSEDYSFCRRWQAIGGDIWLDLRSKLTHSGPQSFVGDCAQRYHAVLRAAEEAPPETVQAA